MTQNIMVPNVALWRLPRPEPRHRVPIRPRMGGGAEKVEEKIGEILSTKTEEITPKSSIEVDRNVDRIDNSQENIEISSSKKLKTNGSVE